MPNAVTHPPPQELAAFGLGKLSERNAAAIAAHLESCPACRQAVAALPPDSFLGKIRAAGPAGSSFPPGWALSADGRSSASRPPIPAVTVSAIPPELSHHPKFLILRELGRGGMGVVYQARQTMMNRQVVIKVINCALLDQPGALERFRREVQAAAQLSHPNIVTAYDAEQAGELHMLVMEFVPGQSLAEVLEKKGPLPLANACHYMRQVASGLQHAHERGMVHRDIKPSNLMLMPKGQVKILDFGLAKVASERGTGKGLTSSDAYMGTPDYSAPEQATDARTADIRADLYSLGCTLYCLLAGRPPFREDTAMKTILAHLQKQPQPLPELRSDVPAGLWAVVERLLAKEPGQRYQKPIEVVPALAPFVKSSAKPGAKSVSAPGLGVGSPGKGTMIGADTSQIKKILREVPGKAPPTQMPAKDDASPFEDLDDTSALPRKAKRARWGGAGGVISVLAGVGVLLLALVGLWASGVFKVKTKDGTIVLENLPSNAEVLVDGETVTLKAGDGKTITITAGKKHQLQVKKEGFKVFGQEVEIDAGERRPIRVSLQPNSPTEEKQAPKLKTPLTPSNLVLRGHGSKVMHLVFTPDGSRLVSASNGNHMVGRSMRPGDSTVRIWSVESGNSIRVLPAWVGAWGYGPFGIAVSADGRLVAACTSWDTGHPQVSPMVFVWDVATGTRKHYFALPLDTPDMRAVGFSIDGKTVYALQGGQGIIHSWSVADGEKIKESALGPENSIRYLPPGIPSAFVCEYIIGPGQVEGNDPSAVSLWDRETGKLAKSLEGHKGTPTFCAMSLDGSRIISCAPDFSVRLWDVKSGRQILCVDNLDTHIRCVVISSDGKRFITGGEDHIVRLWDSSTGKQLAKFEGHTDIVNCVAISPDGTLAASGSNDTTIHLWQLPIPK
jgi:serine/threonine protein kinase/WD40 repeat protein